MADRVSNYRQVRLIMNVTERGIESWDLQAISVRKGVPHYASVDQARFPYPRPALTPEDIMHAAHDATSACMVRNALFG